MSEPAEEVRVVSAARVSASAKDREPVVRREPEIEVLPPLAVERLRIAVKRDPLMTVSPLKLRARSKLSASSVEKK